MVVFISPALFYFTVIQLQADPGTNKKFLLRSRNGNSDCSRVPSCNCYNARFAEQAISQPLTDEMAFYSEIQFPCHRLHCTDSVLLLVKCQSNTSSNKKAVPLIKTTYSIPTYAKGNKYLNKHDLIKTVMIKIIQNKMKA